MWALATGAVEGEDTKGRRGGANERGATIARRRNEGCRLYPINYLPINLVELRYGSPWLAMSRTDCLNGTLERATHQLDGGGVAVWSRLLCGRLSAYRPSFRCCMHHTFGYQSMATVD